MSKKMSKKGTKQVAAHLPANFVEDWDSFREEVNEHDTGVAKVTGRTNIFNALSFYMESKRESWKKEA